MFSHVDSSAHLIYCDKNNLKICVQIFPLKPPCTTCWLLPVSNNYSVILFMICCWLWKWQLGSCLWDVFCWTACLESFCGWRSLQPSSFNFFISRSHETSVLWIWSQHSGWIQACVSFADRVHLLFNADVFLSSCLVHYHTTDICGLQAVIAPISIYFITRIRSVTSFVRSCDRTFTV